MTYHQNTNVELLSHPRQPAQKLIQLLLTICQFPASTVIHTEARHDAIDDEEAVFVCDKYSGQGIEEFELVFRVEGTGVGYVFLGLGRVHCGEGGKTDDISCRWPVKGMGSEKRTYCRSVQRSGLYVRDGRCLLCLQAIEVSNTRMEDGLK